MNFFNSDFYFGNHLVGVRAFHHHHNCTRNFAFAVVRHGTVANGFSVLNGSDIFNQNWCSVGKIFHDNIFDIRNFSNQTFGSNEQNTRTFFNISAACILVVFGKCVENFGHRNAHRLQLGRIYGDFILLQIATKTRNIGNTFRSHKLSANYPILNSSELHRVITVFVTFFWTNNILVNFSQTCGNRRHLWSSQTCGNVFRNLLQSFCNLLTRQMQINIVLENYRNDGKSETRKTAHLFNSRNIIIRLFQRKSDEPFHIGSAQTWRNRDDLHLIIGDIRNRINR